MSLFALFGAFFTLIQHIVAGIAYIFIILFRVLVAIVVGIAYLCGLYMDHRRAKKGLPRQHVRAPRPSHSKPAPEPVSYAPQPPFDPRYARRDNWGRWVDTRTRRRAPFMRYTSTKQGLQDVKTGKVYR